MPYAGGCPAFTRELRQVQWPSTKNFKPDVPEKYDGKTHSSEFLSIYTIAVQAAGGRDDKILANYFPLVLKPNVRSWLMHLPDNSISSWADLCHQFVGAFIGGHKPHCQESDLHLLAQKEGEPLRKYIQRFSSVQHNIPDVHPAAVISAFHQNVQNRRMREEMAMCKIRDVSELYALADKCARAEEGRRLPGENIGAGGSDSEDVAPTRKNRRRNNRRRKGKEVLVVEQSGNGGGAKEAKAGDSGKEVATEVAVAESRTAPTSSIARSIARRATISRAARKSSSLLSNRKLNTSGATRRRPRKVLEDPARNVPAEEDAAARPSSGKETDLPAAATRMKMTTTMKIWMMTRSMSRSSRKPQRSCALTAVLLCILRTVRSSSGCGKLMQQNHPSSHAGL